MTRTFFLVILVSLFSIATQAQKVSGKYNSLLWRISKPGTKKDSYLYGTMHATDKKLFNFTDSLYYFIETTDGFATELDMAEMFPLIIESSMNDTLNSKLIVEVVRAEWLAPFKSKLEKKFGKSIGKLTVADIKSVESGMSTDFLRKGEMNTIMDIYLSETARGMGKWVGGIEDFEDQMKVKNSEEYVMTLIYGSLSKPKESQVLLDKLIKIYLDEALDQIDLSSSLWRGSEKIILNDRNIKMARRIDSLMAIRPSVFAVGAAHIPGDTGVVELLKKRGYKVSPVYSQKRIPPKPLIDDAKNWTLAHPADNFFNVVMPGKASVLKSEDRPGYEPMMYTDLRNLVFYMSFGMDASGAGSMKKEEMYGKIKDGFAKKGTVKSEKPITIKGIEGKEYLINSKDGDIRLQIFLPGRFMAINMLASYKGDSLFGAKANRFLESVTFDAKQISASVSPKASITTLSLPKAGFKIDFPGKYTVKKGFDTEADSMWDAKIYTHIGKLGQVGYWMVTMESKSGYYSNNDTGYFQTIKQNNEENLKTKAIGYRQFEYNGYPACEFSMDYKIGKEKGKLLAKIIIKGNKRYYFYSVFTPDPENEEDAKKFIQSFQFVDLPSEPWNWTNSAGEGIRFWTPDAFTKNSTTEDSTNDFYNSYDKIRSNSFLLMKERLPKYQWWTNDSSFFSAQQNRLLQPTDSLLSIRFDTIGKYKSAEMIVGMQDNHLVRKVKILPYGDSLYIVFVFASRADLDLPDYKKFFEQVEFSSNKSGDYYRLSKAKLMLEDLNSNDSATFEDAVFTITSAPFVKEDLPLLHQALLKNYQDSATSYYSAKRKIINEIINLDEGTTLEFVRKNYPLLKGKSERIRTELLYLLISLSTTESFDLFKQYALTDRPTQGDITLLGYRFTDSINLTRKLFPDLLTLSSDTSWATLFTNALPTLIDSGYLKPEQLKPYYDNYYRLADLKIPRVISDSSFDWEFLGIVEVLGRIPTKESYERLYTLGKAANFDIRIEALVSLAMNGQEVPAAEWDIIASNKSFRLELYNRLLKIKKENLFPAKYKNQKSLTESELYQVACDEDTPQSFDFIGERSFKYKGKMEKFLLFKAKYVYDDEVSEVLLFAGPYRKGLVRESEVATMLSQPFDAKKINEQVKEELKYYEKE